MDDSGRTKYPVLFRVYVVISFAMVNIALIKVTIHVSGTAVLVLK